MGSSEIGAQVYPQIRTGPQIAGVQRGDQENSPTKSMPPRPSLTPCFANNTPFSVGLFSFGKSKANLAPFYIAHSAKTQELMDQLGLSWGVQYELARGVTLLWWDWDRVYNVLCEKPGALAGSNVDAAVKVRAVMEDRIIPRDANILLWWVIRCLLAPYVS